MADDSPGKDTAVLAFSGPATLRQATDAWTRLCEAAATHSDISLDLAEVSACDLSFIQLVESARRTWAAAGGSVRLTAPANEPVRDILDRGGFLDAEDTARIEFWTHTEAAQ